MPVAMDSFGDVGHESPRMFRLVTIVPIRKLRAAFDSLTHEARSGATR